MNKPHLMQRRHFTKGLVSVLGVGAAAATRAASFTVTPEQVEGPFYPNAEQQDTDTDLVSVKGRKGVAEGEQIYVQGRVLDGEGKPLPGAVVDVWQANHFGRYAHPRDRNKAPLDPNFQGWAVMQTDRQGGYLFKTIKPGAYPLSALDGSGWRPRHIHFKVSCAGYRAVTTQMYFPGDPLIADDIVIASVPENRRHSLIATERDTANRGLPLFAFDIVLGPV